MKKLTLAQMKYGRKRQAVQTYYYIHGESEKQISDSTGWGIELVEKMVFEWFEFHFNKYWDEVKNVRN